MRILLLLLFLVPSANSMADEVVGQDPLIRGTFYLDLGRAGDRVVAVGDRGRIIYSDDEGGSWREGKSPASVLLTAVCFEDDSRGWAVGHDAVILHTRDGGDTWTEQYRDALDQGGDTAGGDVQHEPDAGEDWSGDYEEDLDDDFDMDDLYEDDFDDFGVDTSGAPLLDIWCRGDGEVIATGGFGYVALTSDGGEQWEKAMELLENPDGWHIYGIAPLAQDPETVFVVGEQGTLIRSSDGGERFEALESPYHGSFFGLTSSADPDVLLVHGLQGNLWGSRDAGEQWRKIPTGLSAGINDGTVLEDGSIVLVGNAGAVLISRDGGESFSVQHVPGRQSISSVLARQDGGVIIAGAGGVRVLEDVR